MGEISLHLHTYHVGSGAQNVKVSEMTDLAYLGCLARPREMEMEMENRTRERQEPVAAAAPNE